MKKYFLAFSIVGVLLFNSGVQAAESPESRILKSFENVRQAKTYEVFSQTKQDTSMKFMNKKDADEFNKNSKLKSSLSSVTKTEATVDRTDPHNLKQYSIARVNGGFMGTALTGGSSDSLIVEAVKYNGYEYMRFSTTSQPSGLWEKSTSTFEGFRSLVYNASSYDSNVNILEYAIKKQPKIVKFKKAGGNIVEGKQAEHYSVNIKDAAARKVWEGYLKSKVKSDFYNLIKPSVSGIKNLKFDIWLEKDTTNLLQYNILMQAVAKDKKLTSNINSLTEATYKSVNQPVAIFEPQSYEVASVTSSNIVAPSVTTP